jgi:hypothetical protein
MTLRTTASILLAAALATVGLVFSSNEPQRLRADVTSIDLDTDGDFLPDCVEWVCLTSASSANTDLDGAGDFVEVVQKGRPRQANAALPADHEMRLVVTSNPTANGNEVILHLLFRFMGGPELLNQFDCYAELGAVPGLRIPLSTLSLQPVSVQQRVVPGEGLWVRYSVSLVSEQVLRSVLPCSIGSSAVIGTRSIDTTMPLFEQGGSTCSVVPFAPGLFAIQSVSAPTAGAVGAVPNNRVCVLQLQPIGGGSGGSAFLVSGAECQDCNDLVCGVECAASVGTVVVLPGGPGSITGG